MHSVHACSILLIVTFVYAGCSGEPASTGSGGAGGNGGGSTSSTGSDASTSGTGGTGGTGGSAGGGGSGGAGGGQASGLCAPGKYLLCEDFEGTDVGGIPQGWTKHGEPVAVADDEAVSGTRSLKMGAIESWERRIYHDGSMLGTGHWGRVRYKVQLPVPDAFVHSTIVALYGVGPTTGSQEVRVVDTVKEDKDGFNNDGNGSRVQYLYNVQPNGPEFGKGSDYNWKFDGQWHCAEWHIDGPTQSYDFYIDDQHVEQISIANGAGNYSGSEIPNSFSEVRVGWTNYQKAPPGFTAWVDDIALDNDRIGCAN
jgi:hypothetical protein